MAIRLVSLVLLAALLSASNPLSSPAAQQLGWVLQQTGQIEGKQTAYFSPYGMRLETATYLIIVSAPKYIAKIYNTKSKCYFEKAYKDFRIKMTPMGSNPSLAERTFGGAGAIANLRSRQVFVDKKKRKQKVEFWASNDIAIPQQLIDCCAGLYELPGDCGLPVRVIRTYSNGSRSLILDTLSSKQTYLPISTWQEPAGYKQVTDEMAVLTGDINTDELLKK